MTTDSPLFTAGLGSGIHRDDRERGCELLFQCCRIMSRIDAARRHRHFHHSLPETHEYQSSVLVSSDLPVQQASQIPFLYVFGEFLDNDDLGDDDLYLRLRIALSLLRSVTMLPHRDDIPISRSNTILHLEEISARDVGWLLAFAQRVLESLHPEMEGVVALLGEEDAWRGIADILLLLSRLPRDELEDLSQERKDVLIATLQNTLKYLHHFSGPVSPDHPMFETQIAALHLLELVLKDRYIREKLVTKGGRDGFNFSAMVRSLVEYWPPELDTGNPVESRYSHIVAAINRDSLFVNVVLTLAGSVPRDQYEWMNRPESELYMRKWVEIIYRPLLTRVDLANFSWTNALQAHRMLRCDRLIGSNHVFWLEDRVQAVALVVLFSAWYVADQTLSDTLLIRPTTF